MGGKPLGHEQGPSGGVGPSPSSCPSLLRDLEHGAPALGLASSLAEGTGMGWAVEAHQGPSGRLSSARRWSGTCCTTAS